MAKNSYHEYLKKVPMFSDLDTDELDAVGQSATDLNLKAGNVIFHEGASAHEMIVVVDGTVEVTRDGQHIADIGPGGIAGEMALLTRSRRNSTVTAKTDVSVLHIDGREFASLLDEVPHIAVKMLPVLAARANANAHIDEHH